MCTSRLNLLIRTLSRISHLCLSFAPLIVNSHLPLSFTPLSFTSHVQLSHLHLWISPLMRTSQFHLWYALSGALSACCASPCNIWFAFVDNSFHLNLETLVRTSWLHSSLPPRCCTCHVHLLFVTLKFISHGQLSFAPLNYNSRWNLSCNVHVYLAVSSHI